LRDAPKFYFHLHTDIDATDEEGKELPDIDAARVHAEANALFARDQTLKEDGRIDLGHQIDIEDGHGKECGSVTWRLSKSSSIAALVAALSEPIELASSAYQKSSLGLP
jgi:hypothetical protein